MTDPEKTEDVEEPQSPEEWTLENLRAHLRSGAKHTGWSIHAVAEEADRRLEEVEEERDLMADAADRREQVSDNWEEDFHAARCRVDRLEEVAVPSKGTLRGMVDEYRHHEKYLDEYGTIVDYLHDHLTRRIDRLRSALDSREDEGRVAGQGEVSAMLDRAEKVVEDLPDNPTDEDKRRWARRIAEDVAGPVHTDEPEGDEDWRSLLDRVYEGDRSAMGDLARYIVSLQDAPPTNEPVSREGERGEDA